MRPAAENRRRRRRFGSHLRAGPSRASICIQPAARRPKPRSRTRSGSDQSPGGEITQAGVFGAADAVLAPRPAAVAQFQVSQLPGPGGRGEARERVPVNVGEPQLRAGVRAFLPHDDPHPFWPAGQGEQPAELGDPRAVPDLAAGVVSRRPRLAGMARMAAAMSSVMLNPTE
jgi:hypothetical protein